MPPRELSAQALETVSPTASVTELSELPQIEARAEAARARATRLRQQAEAASGDVAAPRTVEEGRRWLRRLSSRPSRKALIVIAGLVVVCGSLATSALVVLHHQSVAQQRQRSSEFATTARDGVVAMMSISADKARDDMQHFADRTTGTFKASVLMGAEDVVKDLEKSKASTKVAVQAVAVESMTNDSAVVLVAAKSEITKPDQAKPQSRSWRVVVNVERDGGQLKISKVEFVP